MNQPQQQTDSLSRQRDFLTKEEMDSLVLSHRDYAQTVAYNMVRDYNPIIAWFGGFDDFRQEVNIYIIQAARHYDASKGAKFKTYLTKVIYRNVGTSIRNLKYKDRKKFIYAEHLDDTVEPNEPPPPWGIDSIIDAACLLPSRHQAILVRLHIDEWTHQEVGDSIGVTKQRVQQIEASALEKLKKIVLQKQERLEGS